MLGKLKSRPVLILLLVVVTFIAFRIYNDWRGRTCCGPVVDDNGTEIVEPPMPSPSPFEGTVIGPGESAEVQCGEGSDGVQTKWQGKVPSYTSLNGEADLEVEVADAKGSPANGALVKWSLYDWGTLSIEGCKATFTAPDSIGLAYSTSATINARAVLPQPSPTLGAGEGGPIFAGYSTSTRITIYSGGTATCFDPAGVAVSINSVPTTSDVQIVVDTPRVVGRNFFGRIATVRDGEGIYHIQILVDNALYGDTVSQVERCKLSTVKF